MLKRLVILSHRYLGLAIGLLVLMWFATGITMMYAGGMPRLTPDARLERLQPVDVGRVALTPAQAAERAGAAGRATLLTVLDRPAYRFAGRDTVTVFADTGELLDDIGLRRSQAVAAQFLGLPADRVTHLATIGSVDQWTLGLGRQMPLHKFRADDEAAREVYVDPDIAEVVMVTTGRQRALAWVSTIPHWLYFTALRTQQTLWTRTVVWGAMLACVLAALGLVLAVTQFRRTRPFRLSAAVPYRGPMRWHYVTGAIFGLTTLTFAFSGLLSMEPFAWSNATGLTVPRAAMTGGPVDLGQFTAFDAATWDRVSGGRAVKEIEFARLQDEPYYVVRLAAPAAEEGDRERLHQPYYIVGRVEPHRLLVHAGTLEARAEPFSEASVVARLREAIPDTPVAESALLTEYDSYYYTRNNDRPLPVVRVKFADPAETWVYVDPEMSEVLAAIHKQNRVERWLYHGLHSLDFAFWYNQRPLWDIAMITLCLGGLTSGGLGMWMGVRRLRRSATRAGARAAGSAQAGRYDREASLSGSPREPEGFAPQQ